MLNSSNFPYGNYFNEDYFERGKTSGKSWFENYRWLPRRSFREALAIIDHLKLDENSHILDVGCAKGFLVRALRELEIKADGCDISGYALSFAPFGCWVSDNFNAWQTRMNKYTHAFLKDVLEHNTPEQLKNTLLSIGLVSPVLMAVVPLGDAGKYRIREYHMDTSHIIIQNEKWWINAFKESGWIIEDKTYHIAGLKDNWQSYAKGVGNMVFTLERANV
jgi:hypothetical protein